MSAWRESPLLANLFVALLLATLPARGVALPEDLPVGSPETPDQETLSDGAESSTVFPGGLLLNSSLSEHPEGNPMEVEGAFEGDMFLSEEQLRMLNENEVGGPSTDSRNAIKNSAYKWPGGVIYYEIASGHFNSRQINMIAQAMRIYQAKTCIRFKPRTSQRQFIRIIRGNGCYSWIGRQRKRQYVSLHAGCFRIGIILHEFMHAAGFFHEQSRADRDSYVRINWGNIKSGRERNFKKYSLNVISHLGQRYDLSSVMHYGRTAFSKNRRNTIEALNGASMANMGQRRGFSSTDVKKLNLMYGCNGGSSCVDKYRSCPWWRYFCTRGRYVSWMKTNCRKSCKQC